VYEQSEQPLDTLAGAPKMLCGLRIVERLAGGDQQILAGERG
jgi:hypothetical protein